MHIILTHEQADFDAISCLFGAWLLNRHAIPVLPRRMNRNVRQFLNRYQNDFPFMEPDSISHASIESVILVDTQSLVTLRGMNADTRVFVVDHHTLRPNLPPAWKVSSENLAACTTFFIENLKNQPPALSQVQATLLLLGIYEDSGSMTYAATTARDVHSVAWLLENNASLRLAAQFLNPPLTAEQRTLMDRLIASTYTEKIHGQTILVCTADAAGVTDEISSVAHKIRDLLEPDGLFVIVQTNEGIRMVARSTSDQLNVQSVTAHFGGGGHSRAASALVRSDAPRAPENQLPTLESIQDELLALLPDVVRPSITVGSIMSRSPLTISPETTAEQASTLMKRYGFEGYPVVLNGRVVGLLNRRAVDKSLSHKLNLTAGSLMESGEITVHPGDTLEHLQRLMSLSGWGQIPVADPESGKVIGIVTRTDLFKSLTGTRDRQAARQNLAHKLESILPPARLALLHMVSARAAALNLPVYIVGGFVRDLILERSGSDFDIVVEGDAIVLANSLRAQFGGRVICHRRFGTAKWWISDIKKELAAHTHSRHPLHLDDFPETLDLITARMEFYDYPSALPTVERSSIKLDLHRRDFSINTLSLRLDGAHFGELYDHWGGVKDLREKRVRVLHSLSFVDDPTRMLRAVRFEQRFFFKIEDRTLLLISEALPLMRQVSGQRLHHELDLILSEEHPGRILTRLQELDLLKAIQANLDWDSSFEQKMDEIVSSVPGSEWRIPRRFDHTPQRQLMGYIAWLGRLQLSQAKPVINRLRFSKVLSQAILKACELRTQLPRLVGLPASQASALLDDIPPVVLYVLWMQDSTAPPAHTLFRYISEWSSIKPGVTGKTLTEMAIPPGPVYGQILNTLRSAWLDGLIQTHEDEQALLMNLVSNLKKNADSSQPSR